MSTIGTEYIVVGSTEGQIAVYNMQGKLQKMLTDQDGISLFEVAHTQRGMRMALAIDGGLIQMYEIENFEKIGQLTAQ